MANGDEVELLDETTLANLGKEELLKYTVNLTKLFSNFLALAKKNESDIAILRNTNDLLVGRVNSLEQKLENQEDIKRTTIRNSQYLRNKQIEIKMLPADVVTLKIPDLKVKMAELLSLTDTEVTSEDIGKCHPLGAGGKTIIMEFREREKRDEILQARKNLKNKKTELAEKNCASIMILESLCRDYSKLDFLCRRLKSRNVIHDTWFFNGRLFIKKTEFSSKEEVSHINDLYNFHDKAKIDNMLSRD